MLIGCNLFPLGTPKNEENPNNVREKHKSSNYKYKHKELSDTILRDVLNIESKTIGHLIDENNLTYKVIIDYRELQMSETIRGISYVILCGTKDSFFYRYDSYELLPHEAKLDKLYYVEDGKTKEINFKNPLHLLCSPNGCFEGTKIEPEIFK